METCSTPRSLNSVASRQMTFWSYCECDCLSQAWTSKIERSDALFEFFQKVQSAAKRYRKSEGDNSEID